jgi:hypothetical protein
MRFGLPHTLARPDEDATVAIALKFFSRRFNPGFFDWPSLFMYVTTVAFVGYFQFGRLVGWFPYESRFLAAATRDQAPLRVITRSLSAAAGVLTVATVYAIGRRLFDRTTALVGAFFLAVSALHVRDSHFGVTDVAATFLVTWSFLHTVGFRAKPAAAELDHVGAARRRRSVHEVQRGVGRPAWPLRDRAGRGAGTRSMEPAESARRRLHRAGHRRVLCRDAVCAPRSTGVLAALESITAHLRGGHAAFAGPGWVVHATSSLRYGVGVPILIAGALGFLVLAVRDRRLGVLFLIFRRFTTRSSAPGKRRSRATSSRWCRFLCLAAAYPIVEAGACGRALGAPPAVRSSGRVGVRDGRSRAVVRDRDPLGHAADQGRQPDDRGRTGFASAIRTA